MKLYLAKRLKNAGIKCKNGVYDYRLADAIWQFDVDGDKVITVSDALSLLRIAAGIKA